MRGQGPSTFKTWLLAILAVGALTAAKPAWAQDIVAAAAPAHSLLLSALPMAYGVVELRAERRLARTLAVQAIAGAGPGMGFAPEPGLWMGEVGGQLRWYFAGAFEEGLVLAVECVAQQLFGADAGGRRAVAVGPKLAYKVVHAVGLTAEVQVGGAVVRKSADLLGTSVQVVEQEVQPSVTLGLGWTF